MGTKGTAGWTLGVMAAAAGLAASVGAQSGAPTGQGDSFAGLPSTIAIPAVIRDFRAHNQTGGHPDFERWTGNVRAQMVAEQLGEDGNPVLISRTGREIQTQWRDAQGRNINPALFDASRGDRAGAFRTTDPGARIESEASFRQWYEDVPGVNASRVVELVLQRVPNTNRYLFDSATQEPWRTRGGFFPINGELLGNHANNRNFHFTTELETEFVYERGTGQVFTFSGDDDVWVFIGGRLVIDMGGLHSRVEQTIDLDRLSWLQSGMTYQLKIFHAERRTNESNFRMETTMRLRRVEPPATSALFD